MSAYSNHTICDACWRRRNPNRTPFAISDDFTHAETCCFCCAPTKDRIYVREKNSGLACNGEHGKRDATVPGATVTAKSPSDGDLK